eukprot:4304563-Pyramimonas_sp.AAC.1
MLGQCPGYEAIERFPIVNAVAFHRRLGEYREQHLGQVSPTIVGALARGMARLSAPSGTTSHSRLRRVPPRLRIDRA